MSTIKSSAGEGAGPSTLAVETLTTPSASRRGEPAPEAKHTPGPWRVYHDDGVVSATEKTGPNTARIKTISRGSSVADSHLIAAAPDMLRALLVVEQHHAASPHIGLIRAAIAKATGAA